jgi:hypothetical protein
VRLQCGGAAGEAGAGFGGSGPQHEVRLFGGAIVLGDHDADGALDQRGRGQRCALQGGRQLVDKTCEERGYPRRTVTDLGLDE